MVAACFILRCPLRSKSINVPRAAATSKICGNFCSLFQTCLSSVIAPECCCFAHSRTMASSSLSGCARMVCRSRSASFDCSGVQTFSGEKSSGSCMCARIVLEKKTRMRRSQRCRVTKASFSDCFMIVAMSGKVSSSIRWSGWRTRESATKATPGEAAAFVRRTTARSNVMPCAFQGVMAQPRISGNCLRVTPSLPSASRSPA